MRAIRIPNKQDGHAAPITHVALRADGDRLATASYDGTAIVWNIENPCSPRPLIRLAHRRLVNASAWNPADVRLLATASADKTAAIWELGKDDARIVSVLARHTDDINSVAWLPDGERLVCVSEDGRATLWEALTGRLVGSLVSHAAHCMMTACSSAGLVATVGEDGMVTVIDPDTRAARSYNAPSSVEGCAWSHSGDLLAIARDDGIVEVLDQALARRSHFPVASSAARAVAWSDDDSLLFVGGYDGKLHIVDTGGQIVGEVEDDRLWPRSVAAGRGLLAIGSFWSAPFILDQASRKTWAEPARPTHGPNALTVMRERELVIGTDSGRMVFADIAGLTATGSRPQTDQVFRSAAVTRGPILSLAASGRSVAFGTYSGRLGAAESGLGSCRFSEAIGSPVPSVVALPGRLIGGTYDGELIAADADRLTTQYRGRGHHGSIKSLAAIGQDCFASCATDHAVAVGTLERRQVLWEHGNLVNSVAGCTVPGGAVVASASRDHTVKVGWVAKPQGPDWLVTRLETLIGPDESVKCVGLLKTADCLVVLAGSYDFGLYAWELAPAKAPALLREGVLVSSYGQGLSSICAINGHMVAAAGWDGRIALLSLTGESSGPPLREIASFSVTDVIERIDARNAA